MTTEDIIKLEQRLKRTKEYSGFRVADSDLMGLILDAEKCVVEIKRLQKELLTKESK